ncbi:wax ester/triacylglycerol synthase family O-acyltransferase [Rhodococcus tibetensis]|uniref:Diacylglycerol O-acyltransferase n=1 Tax=Rhodococcus tibetensis TaxID=2965064 RepID=A0ABT1QBX4_9NOCA|nr:wax ester/triacylglycerol synthase family O-acyltransferase [Rhodococcus sp. FXJ9.536]MCQ4118600.1 wax ester/triacylglycerol synthase family O-acyltransferase [Rhodococcus sp. FXJ9.536]
MSPTEAMFVLFESPSHPMHVATLTLFEPQTGTAPGAHAADMVERLRAHTEVSELFRKRPIRLLHGYPWWRSQDEVDLEYHVRHTAVPGAGTMADLLSLVSQMHSMPLDPQHPMWEMHVIEGLTDGRTAVYTKFHLSLTDGASGLRLLHRTLSVDPGIRDCPAPWSPSVAAPARHPSLGPRMMLRSGLSLTWELAATVPTLMRTGYRGLTEEHLTLPLQSPPTIFNAPTGRARKVAVRSWPLKPLRRLAACTGAPLEVVVLTMCAGALREYLLEQYALPDAPLTAMLPVPLDFGEGPTIGAAGRGIGAMVVSLGTDEDNPLARLARIADSVAHTSRVVAALGRSQFQLVSALTLSPIMLEPVRRVLDDIPPPFNVTISYTPGPTRPRFWNGARLDAVYPVPALARGQALSITLTSRSGELHVGVVGDRIAVPHLHRIVGHLDTALTELDAAAHAAGR